MNPNSNPGPDSTKYTVRYIPFYDHAGQNLTNPSANEEAMDCDEAGMNLDMNKVPLKTSTVTSPPAVPSSPPPPPPSSAPAISPDNIFKDYGLAHPPSSPPVTFHMIIINEIVVRLEKINSCSFYNLSSKSSSQIVYYFT